MRLLLDTHVWLWWNTESSKLNRTVIEQIADPSNEVFLSAASAWEIAIKTRLGKLPLPDPVGQYIAERMEQDRISELAVTIQDAVAVENLPLLHRDPFDRLLIAQSRMRGLVLVTADDKVLAYGGAMFDARVTT